MDFGLTTSDSELSEMLERQTFIAFLLWECFILCSLVLPWEKAQGDRKDVLLWGNDTVEAPGS